VKRSATLAAAALLAIACGAASAADYKIGFVNTERLFREATPAKRAQQKLEKNSPTGTASWASSRSRSATCKRRSTRTVRR